MRGGEPPDATTNQRRHDGGILSRLYVPRHPGGIVRRVGYGITSGTSRPSYDELRWADVHYVSNDVCADMYRGETTTGRGQQHGNGGGGGGEEEGS